MIPIWAFVGVQLVALCCLRRWQSALIACVMLVNWALCKFIADVTGTQYNWQALAAIDFMSGFVLVGPAAALVILGFPPRLHKAAALVAAFYAADLVCHGLFGWSDQADAATYRYWWRTHEILWGQAWSLLLWEVTGGGKRIRHWLGFFRGVLPVRLGFARDVHTHARGRMR